MKRLSDMRVWIGAAVLALFVSAGAVVWFYLFDDGGVPQAQPASHLLDWIEGKWQAEGRDTRSFDHLLRAQQLAEPIDDAWFDANVDDDEYQDAYDVILLGDTTHPKYDAAVVHMNALSDVGVFDAIRAYRNAHPGLPAFDRNAPIYDLAPRLEFITPFRELALDCAAMARLAFVDGDEATAIEYFRDIFALFDGVSADRIFVNLLVRLSMQMTTHVRLQEVVHELDSEPKTIRALLDMLVALPSVPFADFVEGERRWSETVDLHAAIPSAYQRKMYHKRMSEWWEKSAGKSAVEVWELAGDPRDPLKLLRNMADDVTLVHDVQTNIDSIAIAARACAMNEVDRHGTICVLAIELFRAEHNGNLPATLDEALANANLDASFGIDPIWDTPFIYKHDADAFRGYILYATGDNIDDGGVFPPEEVGTSPFKGISREPSGLDVNLKRGRWPLASDE